MILTGKSYYNFLLWYEKREGNTLTVMELDLTTEPVIQNALIIDWFDSVGVHINTRPLNRYSFYYDITSCSLDYSYTSLENYSSRQEATIQAIKKANDLYNNTDKV